MDNGPRQQRKGCLGAYSGAPRAQQRARSTPCPHRAQRGCRPRRRRRRRRRRRQPRQPPRGSSSAEAQAASWHEGNWSTRHCSPSAERVHHPRNHLLLRDSAPWGRPCTSTKRKSAGSLSGVSDERPEASWQEQAQGHSRCPDPRYGAGNWAPESRGHHRLASIRAGGPPGLSKRWCQRFRHPPPLRDRSQLDVRSGGDASVWALTSPKTPEIPSAQDPQRGAHRSAVLWANPHHVTLCTETK